MTDKRFKIKKIIFLILSASVLFMSSCGKISEESYLLIENSVNKTNAEDIYKASFVLEVKNAETQDLVMFVQGNYSIDKSKSRFDSVIMTGELVQTVYNSPSSFKIAFYEDTYVTKSKDIKILSDMEENILLSQFMCAPAISFPIDKIKSIDQVSVSNGIMYTVEVDDVKSYLDPLLGDDLYSFSGMKKAQKELTEYSDVLCKYIVSENGMLLSRDMSYNVTAYDVVPYFPAHQATAEDYKYNFSVSLKFNYKAFGNDISIDISEFLPDEDSSLES
ncbi:MAG: hypothetical protein E7614_00545 [Ruminococcaceae bacterium]|nr:hypothetical protein [Oscillospiraceae bacterium]